MSTECNREMIQENSTCSENWCVEQNQYLPEKEFFYESIFSLGNGYMGVRGFHEEQLDKAHHEVCTYIAGVFDYIKPGITDMVNTPNYWFSKVKINKRIVDFKNGKIETYKRTLNIQKGLLARTLVWEDEEGNRTRFESLRFLSLADKHNAVLRYKITPLNYSSNITIQTGIDARVTNNPINDDQMKNDLETIVFLREIEKGTGQSNISYIQVGTKEIDYKISEAFSIKIYKNAVTDLSKEETDINCLNIDCNMPGNEFEVRSMTQEKLIYKEITFKAEQGCAYTIDKLISVYTSRDSIKDKEEHYNSLEAAIQSVKKASALGVAGMYQRHQEAWLKKWNTADIGISGDDKSQLGIRYNIFQLIQSNAEEDANVSIGARGLTHGRYKGCYFWDTDIFMLPFYIYANPKAARNLLMYRYNTLPGAEVNAKLQNVDGARYPWMCTIDGREQCDTWDIGFSEVHITADVAYAVNQYYQITGDVEFYVHYGAEILIKTARYWKSRFTYYAEEDCYNMLFVKGPNEYGGVTQNNTFTTMMALNNFKLAIDAIQLLKEKHEAFWDTLKKRIHFNIKEIDSWQDIMKKAVINYDVEKKLYIEDDNFLKMEPIDIGKYKTDDTALYHKICFDRLQRYMALKQADIILLMILLSEDFTREEKQAAWDFYEPITLHDSTLSFGIHGLFAARMGLMDKAWDYFNKSLNLDLDDIMKNTGKEGIHFAALGASWQGIINGFAGIEFVDGILNMNPNLPDKWEVLSFKLFVQENLLSFRVLKDEILIQLDKQKSMKDLMIRVEGSEYVLNGHKAIRIGRRKLEKISV